MRLSRKLWLPATSLVATAVLIATPASADGVGVLVFDQVSGTEVGFGNEMYTGSGTPLLDHFDFRFVNDDKHLQDLEVRPTGSGSNGRINFAYADVNADDQYEYQIAHQRVSSTGLSLGTLTDTCKGNCTRPITRPAGDVEFVIRGFNFHYTGGDHHMDAIGILESRDANGNSQITHYFNDRNNDDEYTVAIDYAWVPRSRFSTVSEISANPLVHATGTAHRTLPAGNKVIRGFFVENRGSGGAGDNHIKGLGFLTNDTSVDIHYGDKDPADSADWFYRMKYAVLN